MSRQSVRMVEWVCDSEKCEVEPEYTFQGDKPKGIFGSLQVQASGITASFYAHTSECIGPAATYALLKAAERSRE